MGFLGRLVYAVVSLVEIVLIFRFVLRLFGANPGSGFVHFVYAVSWPLIAPFIGVFSTSNPGINAVVSGLIEPATVIAFIVYAIVGALLVQLFLHDTHRVY